VRRGRREHESERRRREKKRREESLTNAFIFTYTLPPDGNISQA